MDTTARHVTAVRGLEDRRKLGPGRSAAPSGPARSPTTAATRATSRWLQQRVDVGQLGVEQRRRRLGIPDEVHLATLRLRWASGVTVVMRCTAKSRSSSLRWSCALSWPPSSRSGSTTRSELAPWLSTYPMTTVSPGLDRLPQGRQRTGGRGRDRRRRRPARACSVPAADGGHDRGDGGRGARLGGAAGARASAADVPAAGRGARRARCRRRPRPRGRRRAHAAGAGARRSGWSRSARSARSGAARGSRPSGGAGARSARPRRRRAGTPRPDRRGRCRRSARRRRRGR